MRAAYLRAPHRLELGSYPDPQPRQGEVLVQMRAVGLCGSDLAVYSGARQVPQLPWLMGHEGGGRIIDVGPDVSQQRIGETVVIEPNYPCLDCAACAAGETSVCAHRGILGINMPGILAEKVCVPSRFAHPVTGLAASDEALAMLEPLAVARAAISLAEVPPGTDVLIAGAGSQGLMLIQLLLAQAATPWIMERSASRMAHAIALGARDSAEPGAPERFNQVIDAVGSLQLWQQIMPRLAAPVTVTVIGMTQQPLPVSTEDITRGRMRIQGSMIYNHPDDFTAAIDLLNRGLIQPQRVLAEPGSLEEVAAVFAEAGTSAGKPWLLFA